MLVKFERNRMVQTTQNYELFDKKKHFFLNPFWQMVTLQLSKILISAAETIV